MTNEERLKLILAKLDTVIIELEDYLKDIEKEDQEEDAAEEII